MLYVNRARTKEQKLGKQEGLKFLSTRLIMYIDDRKTCPVAMSNKGRKSLRKMSFTVTSSPSVIIPCIEAHG
jgi:hypothetical protein